MMRTALVTLGFIATLLASAVGGAQPAAAPHPATAPAQQPAAAAPEAYTYQAQGRRDPFVSVIGTGTEPKLVSKKGIGPAGMLTGEITVRGVMQTGAGYLALVQGSDTRTYVMRTGDKLLDGTVKAITSEGLTIVQDVNDPLSLVKTREIRKLLRSKEDAKP